MKVQQNHEMRTGEQDSLLDNIEHAVAEKMQAGHADEARHGFAARLANATPPANETLQQMLRVRILDELAKNTKEKKQTMTIKDRVQTLNTWQLSLASGLAAILTLVLAFVVYHQSTNLPIFVPASPLVSKDVDALINRLNEDSAPRTVVVYPGDYAETLSEGIQHQVVPLVLNGDLAPTTIQAALGAALPSSGLVDIILINQEVTDTTRQVQAVLEQHLYRLYRSGETGTETFGTLERIQFVVGPQDVPLEPMGVTFEGGIELVAGGVLGDPQPGVPLPLAFDWRVTEPVNDSLAMFAHLIHEDGYLIAQWDAVPGSDLFPVVSWEPGELVRHQFALLVPSELPVGKYEILVGIYSSTYGQRYRVIDPEGGADYVVVQQFIIED
jgi:hypothetical protein